MELKNESKLVFSRRRLIGYAWIGAIAVVVGELIAGTIAFLWPKKREAKGEKIFIAGKANDFKVGDVIYFRNEKAFVQRMDQGFIAFSAVCTHLRCIVKWNEVKKMFECPCHGAKFNRNGEVIEGPPPRPLNLLKLQIVEEKLIVDFKTPVERKRFEPSQIFKG